MKRIKFLDLCSAIYAHLVENSPRFSASIVTADVYENIIVIKTAVLIMR